jgi:4a-hydroxytetrahydrobiopterin dehydratase
MTAQCSISDKHCIPCEGGAKPLDKAAITTFMKELNTGWQVNDNHKVISRDFRFKNYYQTMAFVNAIAWMAHSESHHPDLEVGYNHCLVRYNTHAIDGLSENDFICAAKVDALREMLLEKTNGK